MDSVCKQALSISTTTTALPTDPESLACSNFLQLAVRFLSSCGFLRIDFQLLEASWGYSSTSCVSHVLGGKPQKHNIFTSCGSLHVFAPLLVHALFLGCIVVISLCSIASRVLDHCPDDSISAKLFI